MSGARKSKRSMYTALPGYPKYLCRLRYGPPRNGVNHAFRTGSCTKYLFRLVWPDRFHHGVQGCSMTGVEQFRYDGKRALVVGGATGMGAAAAEIVRDLGAEVVVMDYADVSFPVAQSIKVDLRNPEDVDKALDEVSGPVHALFSCAGVADGTEGIMKINFIAHRHIIDRLVDGGNMPSGSAIGLISSVAGLGWEKNLETLGDFLSTSDYESGAKWIEAHEGTDNYSFSKQAINAYVGREAFPLLK